MFRFSLRKKIITGKAFLITVGAILSFGIKHDNSDYVFPKISHFPKMPLAKNNKVTNAGVELGRFLFYDPILSSDSSISCSSCHRQERAFSYSNTYGSIMKNFTKIDLKLKENKNVLPLFNLAWSTSFFWDGRANSIEEQAYHPVKDHLEMNSSWRLIEQRLNRSSFYKQKFKAVFKKSYIDSQMVVKCIAQFERTLLSYNSKFDKVMRKETSFSEDERAGYELFKDVDKGACLNCHSTDVNRFNSELQFGNNGVNNQSQLQSSMNYGRGAITKRKSDIGKFKIPSVRNLRYTAPYMHDGRFGYLDYVLNFYSNSVNQSSYIDSRLIFVHNGGARLTRDENRKIVIFLNTLNDSSFVSNKDFSNPFKR